MGSFKYTDQYRENLMKVIQAKVKGKPSSGPCDGTARGGSRRLDGTVTPQPGRIGGRSSHAESGKEKRVCEGDIQETDPRGLVIFDLRFGNFTIYLTH